MTNEFVFRASRRACVAIAMMTSQLFADPNAVNIDWSNRTSGQQVCVAAGSAGSTAASLVLQNANIILYTYALDVKSYQLPSNDAPTLTPQGLSVEAPPDCDAYKRDVDDLWNNSNLFPHRGESIPLSDTIATLDFYSAAIDHLIQFGAAPCLDATRATEVRTMLQFLNSYRNKKQALDKNPDLSTISFPYQIDNTHYYVFTVTEQTRYNRKLTNATLHWTCGLEDTLTLSVGVMATTLPYRTYTSQSVPSGTNTQNVLAVSGAHGWTPEGLALLNYKLWTLDRGSLPGLAISTGPVFKFGGTPGVSSFGWFAGVSVSLWRRLFITPGMHLGQFADFPLGFASGSPIPSNFGTLTPVTRWSGRFALGVTFQTNSFAKSNSSTPTSTTPPTTSGSK